MALFNTTGTDAGAAAQAAGQTVDKFLGGLGTGAALFAIQIAVFFILHNSLPRLYRPKTYLVPEKERTIPPPSTWFTWIVPVFMTSNAEIIQKCGLDAYFFLRYLRMLLKIFVPAAVIIMPILIPINATNPSKPTSKGLDKLMWNNYNPAQTSRFWAHLILAILFLSWVFHVVRDELRGYIRVRQSYLTSPQHRLRASATTVLITSIPRKWLTYEALNGLYDVMPGGIRNIWINRDFDELDQKIQTRDQLAKKLESAETNLIRNAKRKQLERLAKIEKAKKKGRTPPAELGPENRNDDQEQAAMAAAVEDGPATGGEKGPLPPVRQHSELRVEPEAIRTPELPNVSQAPVDAFGEGNPTGLRKAGQVSGALDGQRDLPSFEITTPTSTIAASESPINRNAQNSHQQSDDVAVAQHWAQASAVPQRGRSLKFWKGDSHGIRVPSPEPHRDVRDDTAHDASAAAGADEKRMVTENKEVAASKILGTLTGKNSKAIQVEGDAYHGTACNEEYEDDKGFERKPTWMAYLDANERDTTRLPLFNKSWLPFMPSWTFMGKKVDVIYYCRKEIARLNMEIEQDQLEPEKYPLMNSAFIQFNHQIAAHMACQCLSHHTPHAMAPRIVEISPQDVIWDNLSIKWWERYVRVSIVLVLVVALVIAWAIPVSFMATISNLSYIQTKWPGTFGWIGKIPDWFQSVISGVIPILALLVLNTLLPIVLRVAATAQGVPTGMNRELNVQGYFFAFSFVQLFLVVTIASSLFTVINEIATTPYSTPTILATNIPKSGNFFFNYLFVQGLSVSAGTMAQLGGLFVWYILRRIVDSTARQKFNRQLSLPTIQWGTFFPVYTTLGCIALIYSIISPLILIFAIITFALFWIVYRYQNLYIFKISYDSGGLMFPKAVNQLFVGVYFLELAMIGLFFLVRDSEDNASCIPQAIVMIVMAVFTIIYQIMLDRNYSSLYRYMPITLEDEAVLADQEYERIQAKRWETTNGDSTRPFTAPISHPEEDIEDRLERHEQEEENDERTAEAIEMEDIKARRRSQNPAFGGLTDTVNKLNPLTNVSLNPMSWKDRKQRPARNNDSPHRSPMANNAEFADFARRRLERLEHLRLPVQLEGLEGDTGIDIEGKKSETALADALFGAFNDEIEDLTPEERDTLVQRAFLHKALRARRPTIWIPRDDLGVSRDEIRHTEAYSEHISISDEWTGLDPKVRVVIKRAPPDFSEVDLIEL